MSALGRVLIVANTAYMIRQFNMENIKLLQGMGYQVEVACNFLQGNPIAPKLINEFSQSLDGIGVVWHQVPLAKSPHKICKNLKAYKYLVKLMKERHYAFIHCQTPVGGAISRLAANKAKTPSIYMVHGFHFHEGSGPFTWLLYYPIEKWLASITDILIVINQDDYKIAQNKMRPKHLFYLPGVGIDTHAFATQRADMRLKRNDIGIPEDKIFVLSVGELNKNKNHEIIIKAMAQLPDIHYAIGGSGVLNDYLRELAFKMRVSDRVHFLGFRKDVKEIYLLADIYCHPSFREGLSVAVMEAMAAGLPVVCLEIRGNKDLIVGEEGGILLKESTASAYVKSLNYLSHNKSKCIEMGKHNMRQIERFDISNINQRMKEIYLSIRARS